MISVTVLLFVPTPSGRYRETTLDLGYIEDTGDEYEDAVSAVRHNLLTWAIEGSPDQPEASEPITTKPLFKIAQVKDEWGDFELPIKPCIRCNDARIEYREREDMCAYCQHIISKEE
jgi:hypothetical protein